LISCPGKGGTGDTWAFLDKRIGEQVAIKFLKRPLPKVLLENIKREFLVCFFGSCIYIVYYGGGSIPSQCLIHWQYSVCIYIYTTNKHTLVDSSWIGIWA
jgi:hypothetical protein